MPWPMRFGPAAQDDDLAPVGRLGLALGRPQAVALVAGVEVGRARFELGGAGVDALEHRPHAERAPALGDLGRRLAGELGQPLVGEALLLEVEQALGVLGQAACADLRLDLDQLLDLAQEPRLVLRGVRDLLDRQAVAEGLGDHQDAVGRRPRQRADDGRLVGRALDLDLVQAGQARSPSSAAPSAAIPGRCGRSTSPRPRSSSRW